MRLYIEIIPREITNVVRKSFMHITNRCRSKNNSAGYQALNNAIINSEYVGSCLFSDVITQNLLFIFGEIIQSLNYALMNFSSELPLPHKGDNFCEKCKYKQSGRSNQTKTDNRAVILCKLKDAKLLKNFIFSEK